jgi:hypothetical protein
MVRATVERRLHPVETSLLSDMDDIVRVCLERLFREYTGDESGDPEIANQESSPTGQEFSENTTGSTSNMLYAAFNPPSEDSNVHPNPTSTSLQQWCLTDSSNTSGHQNDIENADAFLSIPNISSDSGYESTNYCNCPEFCFCPDAISKLEQEQCT